MRKSSLHAPQPVPDKTLTRKHGRRHNPELMSRDVEISSFEARVWLGTIHDRGNEPYIDSQSWLELRGMATEPVRDVTGVRISLYARDDLQVGTARPASVGAVIGIRPEFSIVLPLPQVDFDRIWALAVGGHLKYAHLCFTKPRYNHGLVVSASFTNELEE
jgi:hypothetical protein